MEKRPTVYYYTLIVSSLGNLIFWIFLTLRFRLNIQI